MRIETFKCGTGAGWGILVNGLVDCDIPYGRTEYDAVINCLIIHPWANEHIIITTEYPEHYSNQ